jgi:hypothetical protein
MRRAGCPPSYFPSILRREVASRTMRGRPDGRSGLLPCWVRTVPLRVQTQTAPMPELSTLPPTMAVLPSADSATEMPCSAFPTAAVPTSFGPCCENCASAGCDEKRRLARIRTNAATDFDDLTFEIVQTRAAIAVPLPA